MSHEGYVQHWCAEGHDWESVEWPDPGGYPVPREETHVCPYCEGPSVAHNWVDDTNCDEYGKLRVRGRLPTVEELWEHAHEWRTRFWHRDLPECPQFIEAVNNTSDKQDQKALWKWAVEGD